LHPHLLLFARYDYHNSSHLFRFRGYHRHSGRLLLPRCNFLPLGEFSFEGFDMILSLAGFELVPGNKNLICCGDLFSKQSRERSELLHINMMYPLLLTYSLVLESSLATANHINFPYCFA
jgi:hypothetical protein